MQRNYMYKFLLLAISLLLLGDAWSIDGNYAAPYASQWDSQSQIAAIPLETFFGALLLILNLIAAAVISLRGRKRQIPQ